MGLDIYGHLYKKTRTRNEGENLRDYISELEEQADKTSMKEAKAAIKKGIADMKKAEKENKLFPFVFHDFDYTMKLYFPYDFQRNGLKEATDIKTVEEWAKNINWKTYYKPSDFYFRKVNCIYAYFQDRLEEEVCEVTKEDVIDIKERATKILAAHNQETAQELLPTQAGFFFGSTDYDEWYYYDMKEILKEFGELLMRWKEDDICFVMMSW
jgi:hypothetical protein